MRNIISGLLIIALASSCVYTPVKTRFLHRKASEKTYDIIVVPGVPFEGEEWSRIMKARIYWSKILIDEGVANNIMFSGSSVYTPYYEAKIMALYAEAIGVPREKIYIETKAEHSTENIYYSFRKARLLGFEKVALATDPFQARALKSFIRKKIDPEIGIIPIIFKRLKNMESEMIDPKINIAAAYNDEFISITEREGFFKRLNGTRGKNLESGAYEK